MYYPRRPNKPRRVIHSIEELPVICDAAEAGLLLRCTPEKICRMARDGILKGTKSGERNCWLFRRDDLVAYLDRMFESGVVD